MTIESPVWIPSGSKFLDWRQKIDHEGQGNRTHLHITDRDAIISAIAYNLILNFLPPLHTLLNQHLRTSQ